MLRFAHLAWFASMIFPSRARALSLLYLLAALSCPMVLAPMHAAVSVPKSDPLDGFKPIFDGKSLDGWQGDPAYWHVESGCMVGVVTPETLLTQNSFIIWRGGEPEDFEMKVTYRVSSQGNSGVNYRSDEMPGVAWALRGPQADIDGEIPTGKRKVRHTGQIYEERGRTFLALRGQIVRAEDGKLPQLLGSLGESEDLSRIIKNGEWNEYHLIARGSTLVHILNGRVVSIVIDDAKSRPRKGLIGVQVHVGPPMKIEYREILLKTL